MSSLYKVIGVMSGTSCDGIDLACIETDGLSYSNELCSTYIPYEEALHNRLLEVIRSRDYSDILRLEIDLTLSYVRALESFREEYNISNVDLIGLHGQTIKHEPNIGATWQLGNPELLANRSKTDVIYDFRKRDMVYGGQGAPIIPVYHKLLSERIPYNNVLIVNLGGIVNVTWCDKLNSKLKSFDICPCNALMNDWLSLYYDNLYYDNNGELALSGTIDPSLMSFLEKNVPVNTSYPNSLDRDCSFIRKYRKKVACCDALATISDFISSSIMKAMSVLGWYPEITLVAGGGRKHVAIMQHLTNKIRHYNSSRCIKIDDLGINGDTLEASAFAYLAVRSLLNYPITGPDLTGATESVSGGILCKYR